MRALVLGGAVCVWDDLKAARRLGKYDAVGAVNRAGIEYPGELDFWATLHPEHMKVWRPEREKYGYPAAKVIAAHRNDEIRDAFVTDYKWPGMGCSGSSSLFLVKVLLEHGFTRIVLCGVPMDARAHFHRKAQWADHWKFQDAWRLALPRFKDQTRSMSGWTKDLLGEPTREWLA